MRDGERKGEEGSMLVGLVVAIFLILLVLSVAAPTVAKELQRERELETVHRADQYVRAIQLYYKKIGGQYPSTIEQLEKTNNVRFLRQRYVDPMTGKADWRLIKMGEAKTTVKGFFGKPLTGLAPGLGSAAGMASSGGIGAGAAGSTGSGSGGASGSAFGSSSGGSGGSAFGSSSGSTGGSAFGSSSGSGSAFGSTGSSSGGSGTGSSGSTGSSGGIGSQSATSFTGGGAPFVGVGVPKDGSSLIVVNEQPTYKTWEFLYDPRVEQMKAQSSLFGGGPVSAGGTGLGSASGMSSGVGGSSGGSGSAFGSGSGSSFGSGSGSSFGSGSSSGFGSSPSTGTGTSGTAPTTQPQ
jgi:type II secretory pathway pseudopilin PulG